LKETTTSTSHAVKKWQNDVIANASIKVNADKKSSQPKSLRNFVRFILIAMSKTNRCIHRKIDFIEQKLSASIERLHIAQKMRRFSALIND
jgi:hypothetical protein